MASVAQMTPSRLRASMPYGMSYSTTELSMADTLPSIDFGYDELRERMATFTARFDDFIARGRKSVLDRRNDFRMGTAELQESQRARKQAIQEFEVKATNIEHATERETQETEELNVAIKSLEQQKEERALRRDQLQSEVQALQADIRQKREEQMSQHRALEAQARHDLPELRRWEELLRLRIEGAQTGSEKLRFVYTGINKQDEDMEAWFEIDFANGLNKIVKSRPMLRQDDITKVEARLRNDRDVGAVLTGMRALFVAAIQP